MNENEHAARLAHDLDMRLSQHQTDPEQTAPEDHPLLDLAGSLFARAPFAPTPTEQARLRSRFEALKTSPKNTRRPRSAFFQALRRAFRPALQTAFWAVLFISLFIVTALLIANLLGRPTVAGPGPTPTPTPPQPSATPTPIATPTPKSAPQTSRSPSATSAWNCASWPASATAFAPRCATNRPAWVSGSWKALT